jgi:hypothetical protein
MRYQDLEAAEDLLEQAADADSGHLTLARVGEDRRESQVASQPMSSFAELREWFHGAVGRAQPGEDGIKLRLRMWNGDNRAVRGVTIRAWEDREPIREDEGARSLDTDGTSPIVVGDAVDPTVQSTERGLVMPRSVHPGPSMENCPSCMMLQAGLLAARVEVAQLIQQLRQAEDRLWRLQERNGELTRDLRQYKQALALANRENERKSAYLRKAKIVADYVNNTV